MPNNSLANEILPEKSYIFWQRFFRSRSLFTFSFKLRSIIASYMFKFRYSSTIEIKNFYYTCQMAYTREIT